jgi:hypothetical protein
MSVNPHNDLPLGRCQREVEPGWHDSARIVYEPEVRVLLAEPHDGLNCAVVGVSIRDDYLHPIRRIIL